MTALQKIIAGSVAGLLWLGAIVARHFFPDLAGELGTFTMFCASALTGLGVHAAGALGAAPDKQAGCARLPLLGLLAAFIVGLCLLAACTTPPTPGQQSQIRMACAADAGIRPSVDVMLMIPGLAKPEEVAAVVAARAIIDPICKDPAAPFAGGDPYVAVTQASASVAGVLVQVESRKAGK